jgi:hypothetical protein
MIKVKGSGEMLPQAVASEAARITSTVIKTIVGRGGLPDWSRFELSSGSEW